MVLRIPGLILLGLVFALIVLIIVIVIAYGFYSRAQKRMADDVVPDEEANRRS